MANRVQTYRSSVPGARPTGIVYPGELYVNWPDIQLGTIDATNAAVDLLAVRFFSALTTYAVGDFALQGGFLYRCILAVATPGAFTPANWEQVKMASDPPIGGPYLPLLGGTLTGPLTGTVATFSGLLSGAAATFTGLLTGVNALFSGAVTALRANINGAAATARSLFGQTAGSNRWEMQLGGPTAETGANAGSNFNLLRYDDTGVLFPGASPLTINRATGLATFVNVSAPQAIGDNRIINGNMRIDQRNAGASGAAFGYTVDRWFYNASATGLIQWQQIVGGPSGFPYCLHFQSLSAHTIVAADYFQFFQSIEADMVSDFAWGTASAQPVTLSFWVTSSKTGNFSGGVTNYAGTRSYPFSFSLPTANTWTKIILTIPGDTTGTWVMNGNGGSAALGFDLGSGTTWRGTAGAWVNGNFMGVTGAQSIVNTNGATFSMTGVKLEIGSVATPYNRQSLAKSMADCQRYYQTIGNTGTIFMMGYSTAGSNVWTPIQLPVIMRAAPTATPSGLGYTNTAALIQNALSPNTIVVACNCTATGNAYISGTVALSAEL